MTPGEAGGVEPIAAERSRSSRASCPRPIERLSRLLARLIPGYPDGVVWIATTGAASCYMLFFGYLVVQKSQILQNADDFPYYLQALWSTWHDRPFAATWRDVGGPGGSLLGLHLELTLGLLAPLYAVAQDPAVLLVVQVAAVAAAAFPIAMCAARLLGGPVPGCAFALAHLANPYLQRALFYDFHPESLQFLALTAAAAFLILERNRWFVVAAVLACLTKEDSGVHIFALGLYAWLAQGRRRLGVATMAAAIASVVLGSGLAVPWFRGDGAHTVFALRFPRLGPDLPTIVRTVLLNPVEVIDIIWDPVNFQTLLWVLVPFVFLPVASWRSILLIAPPLALVCLTQSRHLKTVSTLYGLSILPLFPFAAMIALVDLSRAGRADWRRRIRLVGSLGALAASLGAMLGYGPTPVTSRKTFHAYYLNQFPLGRGFSWEYFRDNDHARVGRRFIREQVPTAASLAVEIRLASHVANRRVLRTLSETPVEDWLFFDLYGPAYVEPASLFRRLLSLPDYGVVAFDDGYTLMRKGASGKDNGRVLELFENRFEAEALRATTGSDVADHRVASRMARRGRAGRDREGFLVNRLAPMLEAGEYDLAFELRRGRTARAKPSEPGPDRVTPIATIEITEARTRIQLFRRPVWPEDLGPAYRTIRIPVRLAERGRVEVRVWFSSVVDLWLDRIDIQGRSRGVVDSQTREGQGIHTGRAWRDR